MASAQEAKAAVKSPCQLSSDAQRCPLSPSSDNQLSVEPQALCLPSPSVGASGTCLPWRRGKPAAGQVASLAEKGQNSRMPTLCRPSVSASSTSEHSSCPRPGGANGAGELLAKRQHGAEKRQYLGTPSPKAHRLIPRPRPGGDHEAAPKQQKYSDGCTQGYAGDVLTPPPGGRLICMAPPQRGHWRRRREAPAQWLRSCGAAGAGLRGARRPGCRRRCHRGTGSGQGQAPRARGAGRPGARWLQLERTERPPAMSRKKTLKSKGASAPAASAIPASNEPRPARPGTARPGPQVPPNGLLQPGRPSLGGGGDFYDVAFKVSGAPPPPPPHARAAGGIRRGPMGEGSGARLQGLADPRHRDGWSGTPQLVPLARCIAYTHTAFRPGFGILLARHVHYTTPSWQGSTRSPVEITARCPLPVP